MHNYKQLQPVVHRSMQSSWAMSCTYQQMCISPLCPSRAQKRKPKPCSPLAIQIQYISPNYFLISISFMYSTCRRKKRVLFLILPLSCLFDLSHITISLLLNWFFCIICIIKTTCLLGVKWTLAYLLHSGRIFLKKKLKLILFLNFILLLYSLGLKINSLDYIFLSTSYKLR